MPLTNTLQNWKTMTMVRSATACLLVMLASVASYGQTLYHVDSSEKVRSLLITPMSSGQATPFKVLVSSGDGAKFARIGVPLQIAISPAKDSEMYVNWELDSVSAVSGDTLTISKRKLSNSQKLTWSAGAWVRVVNDNGVVIKQLQDRMGGELILPDTTGHAGQFLTDSAGGKGPRWGPASAIAGVSSYNTRTGVVVPVSGDYAFSQITGTVGVTQGGTGLTTIAINKMLYASALNTLAPLTLGTGLQITTGTLDVNLSSFSTSDLSEGSRLYYTDVRSRAALSAVPPIVYSSTTGAISESQSGSVSDGWLSASDWNRFNTASAGLPDTAGNAGKYLRHPAGGPFDWATPPGTGTVTSVSGSGGTTGLTLTGGAITTTGTLTLGGTLVVANGGTGQNTYTNGQLLIGNTTGNTLTKATITGTANQVVVTNGTGSITLSTPQSIATTSDVTFDSLALTKRTFVKIAPTTTLTNIITSTTDTAVELSIHGKKNQSVNLFEIYDNDSSGYFLIDTGGNVNASGAVTWHGGEHLTGDMTIDGTTTTNGIGNTGTISNHGAFNETGASTFAGNISQSTGSATFQNISVGTLDASGTIVSSGSVVDAFSLNGFGVILSDSVGGPDPDIMDTLTVFPYNIFGKHTLASVTTDASPPLYLVSHGWNTTATAHDSEIDGRLTFIPTTGTTVTGKFSFATGNAGLGFTERMSLSSANILGPSTLAWNGAKISEAYGGTAQSTYTTGDILYASATNTLSKKAIGGTNNILTVVSGAPTWTGTPSFGTTTLTGAINLSVSATKTTTYTATTDDCVIPADATSAAFTITLPASPAVGQAIWVTKIDASVNAVTVAPNTSQSIVGLAGNLTIPAQGTSDILVYMGSNKWLSR